MRSECVCATCRRPDWFIVRYLCKGVTLPHTDGWGVFVKRRERPVSHEICGQTAALTLDSHRQQELQNKQDRRSETLRSSQSYLRVPGNLSSQLQLSKTEFRKEKTRNLIFEGLLSKTEQKAVYLNPF